MFRHVLLSEREAFVDNSFTETNQQTSFQRKRKLIGTSELSFNFQNFLSLNFVVNLIFCSLLAQEKSNYIFHLINRFL